MTRDDYAVLHLNSFDFNSPGISCFIEISLQNKWQSELKEKY